jgi:hypothetical protein
MPQNNNHRYENPLNNFTSYFNPTSIVFIIALILLIVGVFTQSTLGFWSLLLSTSGSALLASWVSVIYDRDSLVNRLESMFKIKAFSEQGFRRVHVQMDFGDIFRVARNGDTVYWHDTYCALRKGYIEDVKNALEEGVRIHILAIDPDCPNAICRSNEMGEGQAWIAGLKDFITTMSNLRNDPKYGHNLELRIYDGLTCVPFYILFDRRKVSPTLGYFSIFLNDHTADCTHFEIVDGKDFSRGRGLLTNFVEYFDKKWAGSKSV